LKDSATGRYCHGEFFSVETAPFSNYTRIANSLSTDLHRTGSVCVREYLEHEFKLDQYYRYQLERPTNRGEDESHAAVALSLLPTFLATTVLPPFPCQRHEALCVG
jgi:hypothetical protein